MPIESAEDAQYAVYIQSDDPNAPGLLKRLCEELAERLTILGQDYEVVLYGEHRSESEQQVIFWNPESVVEEWEIA